MIETLRHTIVPTTKRRLSRSPSIWIQTVDGNQCTGTLSAEFVLNVRSPGGSAVVVHRDTLVEAVEQSIPDNHFIVATDDSDAIVGLISCEQLHERLRSANVWERARWGDMPIGSLINALDSAKGSIPITALNSATECTAIAERGHLVGIAMHEDIFVSWKRLEPMLSGAVADPLTGLMNRMAFERRLQEEWQRAIRTGCSVAILVVDLDRFKSINDQYGHQAGDEVIRHVAAQLECSLRSYDLVARYGGDEFTALCLGCRPGEIEIPIQRILATLNSSATALDSLLASASVSVGAAVRHDSFANSSPAELFMAADQCLYRAKQSRGIACCQEFGVSVNSQMTPIRCCDDSMSAACQIA